MYAMYLGLDFHDIAKANGQWSMVLLTHVLISLMFEVQILHLYHQAITSNNLYRLVES